MQDEPQAPTEELEATEFVVDLDSTLGLAWELGLIAGAVALAVAVHWLAYRLIRRWADDPETQLADEIARRMRGPTLILLVVLSVRMTRPARNLPPELAEGARQLMSIGIIVLISWTLLVLVSAVSKGLTRRHDMSVSDNLRARRMHTQVRVIARILTALVIILGSASILMTFPGVRQVGASVLASAGLAGLIVGFAARSSIANFIAGVQVALAEPFRLDDVVIIAGEWGRIEEITTTYVVVRIWDERRLIVPFSHFLDEPFQNWTRTRADIIGSVFWHVDYTAPLDDLRAELKRITEASPKFDGRVCVLQVTDARPTTLEIRALVSARNSGDAWDLRCEVREKMIAYIKREHPGALPKFRTLTEDGPRPGDADLPPGGPPPPAGPIGESLSR